MTQTSLEIEFGDGEYVFDLKVPQLIELQEKRGCGIFAIYGRVLKGRYIFEGTPVVAAHEGEAYVEDLFEVIRLALIGGNAGVVSGVEVKVSPPIARRLVERYCHERPLKEVWEVAAAIVGARIVGYEPPKKDTPAQEPATSQTDSTQPTS